MGRIVTIPNDATPVSQTRNSLNRTQVAVNQSVPGDIPIQAICRAQRSSIAAVTVDPTDCNNTQVFGTGVMRMSACYVPQSTTAAKIAFGMEQTATGAAAAGFNGVTLFSFDINDAAGVPILNLVDQSASSFTPFAAADQTLVEVPLLNGYTIGRGLYYIGVAVNFTGGAPGLKCTTVAAYLNALDLGMPRVFTVTQTSSTVPRTISPGTAAEDILFAAVLSS